MCHNFLTILLTFNVLPLNVTSSMAINNFAYIRKKCYLYFARQIIIVCVYIYVHYEHTDIYIYLYIKEAFISDHILNAIKIKKK